MAKVTRVHRKLASRRCRSTPYSLPSRHLKDSHRKKHSKKALDHKQDWEDATCAVCLEYPHNAVLLLCSSHDKGCRPYMCATSYRYSNCLDQYEKAYKKVSEESWAGQDGSSGLACPLCRGQVKGWTVVESARTHLNAKRRSCMQENCTFNGTYKELRKHVKQDHPTARPRQVDPVLEQNWKRLEHEREHNDVMSTIASTMPGAMVLGDYVIERNNDNFDSDFEDDDDDDDDDDDEVEDGDLQMGFDGNRILNVLFMLQSSIGLGGRRPFLQPSNGERLRRGVSPIAVVSDEDDDGPEIRHRPRGRVVVGSGRRRRRIVQ
ncbi:hypothetical protein ACHQM5_022691 [Ranunculus cassubicifolius]